MRSCARRALSCRRAIRMAIECFLDARRVSRSQRVRFALERRLRSPAPNKRDRKRGSGAVLLGGLLAATIVGASLSLPKRRRPSAVASSAARRRFRTQTTPTRANLDTRTRGYRWCEGKRCSSPTALEHSGKAINAALC